MRCTSSASRDTFRNLDPGWIATAPLGLRFTSAAACQCALAIDRSSADPAPVAADSAKASHPGRFGRQTTWRCASSCGRRAMLCNLNRAEDRNGVLEQLPAACRSSDGSKKHPSGVGDARRKLRRDRPAPKWPALPVHPRSVATVLVGIRGIGRLRPVKPAALRPVPNARAGRSAKLRISWFGGLSLAVT